MDVFARSRVTTVTTVRRVRRIPPTAQPLVTLSKPVKPQDVVAVNELPGELRIIRLASLLRSDPKKVEAYLRHRVGDHVNRGEILAERRMGLFGRRRVMAPIEGIVVQIKDGQLVIEGDRKREEFFASVPGRVVSVEQGRSITIETVGAQIQIAWGYGGLAWGTLKTLDSKPGLQTDASRFNIDHRGAVVAIGSPLTPEFLQAAVEIRVKGLIASSMGSSLTPEVMKAGFPVGVTQGFGQVPMTERILNLLNTYNGREVALDMSSSADWREARPEIIIPVTGQSAPEAPEVMEFKVGQKARVLQPPYMGEIGTINALSDDLSHTESGFWLPGAMVHMSDGQMVFVPFANLEHLG